jgi:hypothetical protein
MAKLDRRKLAAEALPQAERITEQEKLDLLEDNLIAAKSMEGEVYVDENTGEIVKKGQYLKNVLKKVEALELTGDAITALDAPVSPRAVVALRKGDLDEALLDIATTSRHPLVRRAGRMFLKNLGGTTVKVVRGLKNGAGKRVSGMFDPNTNTVLLDAESANSTHVVLHEVAHALTSAAIANPSSTLTRKLNKLFNDVKDDLGTAYGTTSLDEFVAEAFSNPEFQHKLDTIFTARNEKTVGQRLKEIIVNFFRRLAGYKPIPAKAKTPSYAEFNEMIEGLLAPAPDSRFADALHLPNLMGEGGKLSGMMGAYHRAADKVASEHLTGAVYADRMSDLVSSDMPTWFKQIVTGLAPSQPLADMVGRRYGKQAGDIAMNLHRLFLQADAKIWHGREGLDSTLKGLRDLGKASPKDIEILDTLTTDATKAEVDPDPMGKNEKGERGSDRYKNNPEKVKEYEALNRQFEQLSPEGQKMYREVRESYVALNARMKQVLLDRIRYTLDENGTVTEQYKMLESEITKNMFSGEHDPYFPLVRLGNYWLEFDVEGDPEPQIMSFMYSAERERYVRMLEQEPKVNNISRPNKLVKARFVNAPNQQFVNEVLGSLRTASEGLDGAAKEHMEDQMEQVMRLFIRQLPETSFAKAFNRRKKTEGHINDIVTSFEARAYELSRQAEQIDSARYMQAELDLLRQHIESAMGKRTGEILDKEGEFLFEELAKRVRFATNPPSDQYARMANRIAFLGTLGVNVSSALVNLTQVPMIVAPYMAAKTDWRTATGALGAGYRLFVQAPTSHVVYDYTGTTRRRIDAPGYAKLSRSVGNYYESNQAGNWVVREDLDIDDKQVFYTDPKGVEYTKKELLNKISPIVQELYDTAQDNRSITYELLDIAEAGKGSGKSLGMSEKVNLVSAYMFHHAERMNRQTAAVAFFLNELQRLENNPRKIKGEVGLTGEELEQRAARNAMYDTLQTNGGATLNTAPRLAQQGILRVAMMYRTFGLQMYYHLGKTMREALSEAYAGDKQGQKIAQQQILQTMGIVAALTGVSGAVPMYSAITDALSLLLYDEDEPDLDARVRMALPEVAYSGLSNELTKILGGEGVEVSGRIGISDIVLHNNRFNFDPSVEKTLVSSLGGPFWGYASSVIRGVQDLSRGNIDRGVESIMPAAVRNVLKTARYGTEGALTRRGDAIMSSPSAGLLAAQLFGFAPAEYIRNQEMNQIAKGIDRATNERRTRLLKQYYMAMRMADTEEAAKVRKEMMRFNKRHPNHAITPESVERSQKQHMATSLNTTNGVLFSPKMRAEMNQLIEDMR